MDYASENEIPFEYVDNDIFTPMMPMSPLILLDYVGLDISYSISKYFESVLHQDFKPGKIISEKIENKELGMKSGQGLYTWNGKIPPNVDRTQKAHILSLDLLLALQANEGCRLLEEGVVKDWTTIDKTMRNGFNSLGPISILADGNDEKWTKILEDFADKTGKEYLYPCEMMKSGKYKEFQYS
ncbi:MAG: 3-hydroxyacyl-CoA dehydrogenase family protein [Promethearchaeota archaeon]